jgi:hypothetical protein
LNSLAVKKWTCHLDLHETTDSDATEFMPAKNDAEAGLLYTSEVIPDGFYLRLRMPSICNRTFRRP